MYRPYVTELPARKDLDFRTNSDLTVGVVWLASDGVTPVPVADAELTLEFDVDPPPFTDPPTPPELPVRQTFTADPAGFELGQVLVTIPHTVWDTLEGRSGNWDIQATSTAPVTRCLIRGIFIVEPGVSL